MQYTFTNIRRFNRLPDKKGKCPVAEPLPLGTATLSYTDRHWGQIVFAAFGGPVDTFGQVINRAV